MINLKNLNIILTGATGVIGNSILDKLVTAGSNIVATGTNEGKLKKIQDKYKNVNILKFDISDHSRIEDFVENCCKALSNKIDILINNAGITLDNISIRLTKKTKIDDTLDVFPSHGVGGIVGMILTAVFANEVGLIYGHKETFLYHLLAIVIVTVFTLLMSYLLYKTVNFMMPLRVREDQEERGLDDSQHGELFT